MPYTPPAHLSPASSCNPSPAVSRNPSWTLELPPRPTLSTLPRRPSLPRSLSSTHYLNKHRRSPTTATATVAEITRANVAALAASALLGSKDAESLPALNTSAAAAASLTEDHPPPQASLADALISPTLSSPETSDADDRQPRRREVEETWNELEKAVRSISIRRSSSPIKRIATIIADSEPVTQVTSPSMLTPEARRIAHSRSSTETAVIISPTSIDTSPYTPDEESDTDTIRDKPNLVRKASGELVKPALRKSGGRRRYSSMPGTPTYKTVKFDESGNSTRHFLQVDKPMAISVDSSPAGEYESDTDYLDDRNSSRTEWDIKLINFPTQTPTRMMKPVWVERFFLSGDTKSLVGLVAAANISFHKRVVVRFTLDYWKTTSEVSADYVDDPRRAPPVPGHDRFSFSIKLSDQARLDSKTMLLCIRYNVGGQEHWDNNSNANYQIDFIKKSSASHRLEPQSTLGARPLNAIPRSRHGHSASTSTFRGRSPSIDDDMSAHLDSSSFKFRPAVDDLFGDDTRPTPIKLRKYASHGNLMHHGSPPKSSRGLGGRYDFGASLSAALSTAQDRLGKQSGLTKTQHKDTDTPSSAYFAREAVESPEQDQEGGQPGSLATDRPAIGSAQYKDLVSKFCYFTPASSAPKMPPPPLTTVQSSKDVATQSTHQKDISPTDIQDTPSKENSSSNSTEEPSPMLDGTDERFDFAYAAAPSTVNSKPLESGSTSPASYTYMYNRRDGYLSDSQTPTAIHG